MKFMSMREVKMANTTAGYYFFSPGAMRFFHSRVCSALYGRYFVTGERGPNTGERFTIREVLDDGGIETVGEFMKYSTVDDALFEIAALPL